MADLDGEQLGSGDLDRDFPKQNDEAAEAIVKDAQQKWKADFDFVSASRDAGLQDYKFTYGDSYNNFQWPGDVLDQRGGPESDKPTLTTNKVRQNNLLITNDMKKNKPAITFRPTGNGATAEAAKIWNGIARHIEGQSHAGDIYDQASTFMVNMGFGFWRIKTDYVAPDSFDQEIYIRPVVNPWSAMLSMDAKEPDKRDAKHGFVTEDVDRESFEMKYPQFKDLPSELALSSGSGTWVTRDHIRVCEFYKKELTQDTLFGYFPQGSAEPLMLYKSELNAELLDKVLSSPGLRKRPTIREAVRWYFIVGDRLIHKKPWPGKYIPLVQITAEETLIDGKYDCKGHTRYLLDQQRMYNYFSSAGVEFGALQTKTPWIAAAEAIEEHEDDWNSANIESKAVLTYNSRGDDGNEIPKPERIQPPISAPLCIEGMKIASDEIMAASGQYQDSMGAQSNERSAKAIMERQRQGQTSTYHFVDGQARGIRLTGEIIKDLAPKVYDTKRIMQIMQEDGKTIEVTIDPGAAKAYAETQQELGMAIERIFNPNVGSFAVLADVGPDWGTKREESFNAFSMLLGQAPQLIPLLADLLMLNADFAGAETAAERLYRMLPPQATGNGPSPQEQALQQRISALMESLQSIIQDNSKLKLELKGKDQQKLVDAFNAVTQRLKVIGDQAQSDGEFRAVVEQTLREALGIDVTPAADASLPVLQQSAEPAQLPLPLSQPVTPRGSRPGADGLNYQRDYSHSQQYRPV